MAACPYAHLYRGCHPPARHKSGLPLHQPRLRTGLKMTSRVAVCAKRSEVRTTWRSQLLDLGEAVRASVDSEPPLDLLSTSSVGVAPRPGGLPDSVRIDDFERVFLVGLHQKSAQQDDVSFSVEESLEELERLAGTAGLEVVGATHQALDRPNPATYIGSGKLAEVSASVKALHADTVIFDDELSPAQLRNLENELGEDVRVADRTALILDIFEQRARSREGKLQVALASASYQMPRLRRMWTHLERQSGSGNVKGMGELQKEVDKRILRDEMARLRKQLETVRSHRRSHRARRRGARFPVVALVGYTNAGKSTLLNALTQATVLAEDKLFATLDPTTRRVVLPGGKVVLLSDTVGFIQKLPTTLIAAFRATLEEIEEADVLLHVVDISHAEAAKQSETVHSVLDEIDVPSDTPMVTVWNKVDAARRPDAVVAAADARPDTAAVSARSGFGVHDVLVAIESALEESMQPFIALVPYADGQVVSQLREAGVIRKEEYTAEGVRVWASADASHLARLEPFIVEHVPQERVFQWRREQALAALVASGETQAGVGAARMAALHGAVAGTRRVAAGAA